MKSIIVLSEYGAQRHAGEEYDGIVYVSDSPDTTNVNAQAMRIKEEIEKLGKEDEIKVYCDATPVYFTVIENVVFKCAKNGYKVKTDWPIAQ